MFINFKSYQKSIQFYRSCQELKMPYHLKEQLNRASASATLNLSEGSAKRTERDQKKFFNIAYASVKECQSILVLANVTDLAVLDAADHLGAMLYKLSR